MHDLTQISNSDVPGQLYPGFNAAMVAKNPNTEGAGRYPQLLSPFSECGMQALRLWLLPMSVHVM